MGVKTTNSGWKAFPRAGFLVAFFSILACGVWGQYQVFQWENFESGTISPGFSPIGHRFESQVEVVEYSTIPNPPPGLLSGPVAREIGRYGLAIKAGPNDPFLGLGVGIILEREKLGARGRALYQADFYIPPPPDPIPSVAVLAMEPLAPTEREPSQMYRFGTTKNREIFFSLIERDSETATLYKYDRPFIGQIPRGSWHRFQIVFEGANVIRCFVDGHEAPFSPLEESRQSRLQVGIMVAERDTSYVCYVDNLSIQWTTEDTPLPDSPYAYTWGYVPTTANVPASTPFAPSAYSAASRVGQEGDDAPRAPSVALQWLDPETAWSQSQATRTPMLVYFYAPRVRNTLLLNQMVTATPAAQAFLRKHALAAIDVNQLQGGTIAAQYNVFRVPAFVLLDFSGREVARAVFDGSQAWEALQAALTVPGLQASPAAPASSGP